MSEADHGRPVVPSRGRLRPLGIDEVQITGGFWGDRQTVNARRSILHCEHWIEREGWIGNFDAAREGRLPKDRRGMVFSDSDVYKLVEAMAWEVGRSGDADLDQHLRALVARIAGAQEPDGYLNTAFGRPGQPPRYSDLEFGHELYAYGHLIQAAIARGRTTGADPLVEIARRAADHVCATFDDEGIRRVDGHPEIEVALAEFTRYTGDSRYLAQARRFIDRRGHGTLAISPFGPEYFQDDVPVLETTAMSGHAVRALYLASGAVDVAVDGHDDELLGALISQVRTTVARRAYLTGGMGSRHEGEAFGLDFELPPDRAYAETCAGVASVMVNHRLLLATGLSEFADVIERTLFNVVAASPSEDGEAFFYTNTLHQRSPGSPPSEDSASPRAESSTRAPWFDVSCCPTNVARTLASLGAYLSTADDEGVQLHQYASSEIRTSLPDGRRVHLRVTTDYPQSGHIEIQSLESDPSEWTLSLRVPAWASAGASLVVDGEVRPVSAGTVEITRRFEAGDVIALELPVTSRWTWPDPRVDAVRGSVAVERGPLVMCIESIDLPQGLDVNSLRVLVGGQPDEVDHAPIVELEPVLASEAAWPYGPARAVKDSADPVRARLIPYHSWANRGPSTMRVWMPVA